MLLNSSKSGRANSSKFVQGMKLEDMEKKIIEQEAELEATKTQKEELERWKEKFMKNKKLDEALKQLSLAILSKVALIFIVF